MARSFNEYLELLKSPVNIAIFFGVVGGLTLVFLLAYAAKRCIENRIAVGRKIIVCTDEEAIRKLLDAEAASKVHPLRKIRRLWDGMYQKGDENDVEVVLQGRLEWSLNGSSKVSSLIFFTSEDPVKLPISEHNDQIANENAAWASQTGRGLLFYGPDQTIAEGALNLANLEHIAKYDSTSFKIRLAGQRHVFQAPGTTERDLWVPTLKATAAAARSEKPKVTSSKGYEEKLRNRTTSKSKPEEGEEEGEEEEGCNEQVYIRYLEETVTALGGDLQFGKGKKKAMWPMDCRMKKG